MLVSSHTRDNGAKDCSGKLPLRNRDRRQPGLGSQREPTVRGAGDSKAGAWHVQMDLTKYVQPTNTGLATSRR